MTMVKKYTIINYMNYPQYGPKHNVAAEPTEDKLSREATLGAGFVNGMLTMSGAMVSTALFVERVTDIELVNIPQKLETPLIALSTVITGAGIVLQAVFTYTAKQSDRE